MTTRKKPPPDPLLDGLEATGTALITAIMADYDAMDCEPDARERELIRAAGEMRDRLTAIETAIDDTGLMVPTATAGLKANPLLGECRQYAATLGRLLSGIHIGDTGGKNPAKVRAAQQRWANEAKRRG